MNLKDPNKSFVNLNYKCNNRCSSCIMESMNSNLEKDLETIKKEIDIITENLNHIEFNGGEPTLNKNLFEIIRYTLEKKPSIEITLITNSRIFSLPAYVKKLKALDIKNFKICTTLYGNNSKIHDAITRTPKSFEQQIKGIRNLLNGGIKIELRIVINKINYTSLEEMAHFIITNFNNKDFILINFISMKIFGESYKNKDIVSVKILETTPFVEKAIELLQKEKFNIRLSHFPHCVLEDKFWNTLAGITAEKEEIVFLSQCKSCKKRKVCSRIWKSYSKIFGGGEFKPIR